MEVAVLKQIYICDECGNEHFLTEDKATDELYIRDLTTASCRERPHHFCGSSCYNNFINRFNKIPIEQDTIELPTPAMAAEYDPDCKATYKLPLCGSKNPMDNLCLTARRMLWGVPIEEFKHLLFYDKLTCILLLLGIETKEDFIRYLVCDGDPADESCIGHPVLVGNYHGDDIIWFQRKLKCTDHIIAHMPYLTIVNLSDAQPEYEENWHFAKKKPGYKYPPYIKVNRCSISNSRDSVTNE